LVKLGHVSPEVVATLIEGLKDKNYHVRQGAAESLVKLGHVSPEVVATLIEGLKDKNYHVRQGAAKSLVKLGQATPEMIKALIDDFKNNDLEAVGEAIDILVELGQAIPEVIEALIRFLKDKDSEVRQGAAEYSVKMFNKHPEIAKSIVDVVVNKKSVRAFEDIDDSFKFLLTCFGYSSNDKWLNYMILEDGFENNLALIVSDNNKLKIIGSEGTEEISLNGKQKNLLIKKLYKLKNSVSMPEIGSNAGIFTGWWYNKVPEQLISSQEEIYKAISENNNASLSSLINNGADLNKGKDKNTALHYAINNSDDVKLIELLVKGGANLNLTDINNNTPFNLAVKLGKVKIANYLENQVVLRKISKKDKFSKSLRENIANGTYQLCQEKYQDCLQSYQKALELAKAENSQVAYCYILLKIGDYYLYHQNNSKGYKLAGLHYSAARTLAERYYEVGEVFETEYFAHKQLYLEKKFLNSISNNRVLEVNYQSYKKRLKEIRNATKRDIDKKDITIKTILENNTQSIVKLTSDVFDDCIKSLGAPTCEYAIVGLGSMARKEMSLYSDIEYMILLGDKYKSINEPGYQYFVQLALLFELKVISIGETFENILPASMEKIIHGGLALDQGPNTPSSDLHKTNELASDLINIPQNIAGLQSKVDCIMANALRLGILIQGSAILLNKYKQALSNELYKQVGGIALHQKKALELMEQDIGLYQNRLSDRIESLCFNAKADLYRFISNIINHLSLYYGIQSSNSWDRLEELKSKGWISDSAFKRLSRLLDFAVKMRVKTHLFYEKEKETMVFEGEAINNKEYQLSLEEKLELEEVYKVLVVMHKATKEFIQNRSFYYNDEYESTPLVRARLSIAKGDKEEGIRLYQEAMSLDSNNLEIMRELVDLLLEKGRYNELLETAKRIKEIAINRYGEANEDAKYASKTMELARFHLNSQGYKVPDAMRLRNDSSQELLQEQSISQKNTEIFEAVKYGDTEKVEKSLIEGVDINCREGNHGRTLLHIAALRGLNEIIALLIIHKADINIKDNKGKTPLHMAAKYNQVETTKLLLEKGANKEVRDDNDKTAKDYTKLHQLKFLLEPKDKGRIKGGDTT
ncbi:ankyrin repeat domain-containing protein, partial [Candidatus Jidaibacter acanthamoebae]|uniref:ankyrin repeat domain-containing protein n=1 Tax=Candidatus Jidaibacter acanthamoebae TaxID=86105 RepID=UPI0018726565